MLRIISLTIILVISPMMFSQSRMNNHFIAQFTAAGTPNESLMDSLALNAGLIPTFQTPGFGVAYSGISNCCNELVPIHILVEVDSVMPPPRMLAIGSHNPWSNEDFVEWVEYEPDFSPELSLAYYEYLAENCVEADYYQIQLPDVGDLDHALFILTQRPDWSSENWYVYLDGYSYVSDPCMDYGKNSNSNSGNYGTEATQRMAGFVENITTIVEWFPWILNASNAIQNWQWGSSSYSLGEVMPIASCEAPEMVQGQYWTCDTVFVPCPDLDGNNVVGTGDILEFLPLYGDSIQCSPSSFD